MTWIGLLSSLKTKLETFKWGFFFLKLHQTDSCAEIHIQARFSGNCVVTVANKTLFEFITHWAHFSEERISCHNIIDSCIHISIPFFFGKPVFLFVASEISLVNLGYHLSPVLCILPKRPCDAERRGMCERLFVYHFIFFGGGAWREKLQKKWTEKSRDRQHWGTLLGRPHFWEPQHFLEGESPAGVRVTSLQGRG